MIYKIGAITYFAKFTGKHMCWSLIFNKAGLQTWLKRNFEGFSCEFRKFSITPFLQSTLEWMLVIEEHWKEVDSMIPSWKFYQISDKPACFTAWKVFVFGVFLALISRIETECGEIRNSSLYSVRVGENEE